MMKRTEKKRIKRSFSGLMALITLMGSLLSPASVFAEELPEEENKPPFYEEVKDLLDENEIVIAKNLGIDLGSEFDIEKDFSNLEIPDEEAVKVTFQEAKNAAEEDFTTEKLDIFEAIYSVEPLKTDHPTYQISRKLVVKEPGTEIDPEVEISLEDDVTAVTFRVPETETAVILDETMEVLTESSKVITEVVTENMSEEMTEVDTEVITEELTEAFTEVIAEEAIEETVVSETVVVETETEEVYTEANPSTENEVSAESELNAVMETEILMEDEMVEENQTEYAETVESETEPEDTLENKEVQTEVIPVEITEETTGQMEDIIGETEEETVEMENTDITCNEDFHAKLKIVKQDYETGRTILIPNTEFKVYDLERQEYVEQVTSYPEIYIHKSYFTDSQGYLIMPEALPEGGYRIEEVTAPVGYVKNAEQIEVAVNKEAPAQVDAETGDIIIEAILYGNAVKGELNIRVCGESLYDYQKDMFLHATKNLQGAEYGVYASEDIYSSDYQKDDLGNRSVVYSKGSLVTTVVTDENGAAKAENLPLGTYEIREINAPAGYVKNSISKTVRFEYKDQDTEMIEQNLTFTNDRQAVSICVLQQDAENGSAVEGAVLGLYNQEDMKNADGEVILPADSLIQKKESGEDGSVSFCTDIPFGCYYVKELKAPSGYVSSDETIYFKADYQGQDEKVVSLQAVKKNSVTTMEILAADKTTGNVLNGATLSLLDKDGNILTSWTSQQETPHIFKRLKAGETYTIREDFAPYGYLRGQGITFEVKDTADVQKITLYEDVPKALLIINHKGEFLSAVPGTDSAVLVEESKSFTVYAAEDIKAADGVSADYFKKDEIIGTITTDMYGIAKMENLPVGKYYVKESGSEEKMYVDLSYRDQDTAVVTYSEDWQEERQNVEISIMNRDKENKTALPGTVYGLFASEEIKSSAGNVLMEKDQLIEKQSTDTSGKLLFKMSLPVDRTYYVQEITASKGYVTEERKEEFTIEKAENQEVVTFDFLFESEPTVVELIVVDQSSGEAVSGAQMQVCNDAGDVMESWVSGKEGYVLKGLTAGESYAMNNIIAASGYVTAEDVDFTVENTTEMQQVKMEADYTKLFISKTTSSGKAEIKGSKMAILDEDDQVVESWVTDGEAHYVEKLPVGSYHIREEEPAKGYVFHSDVSFELADSAKVQNVSVSSETVKGKVIINLIDAETEEPLMGAEFELRDAAGNVLETLRTDAAGHAESSLYEIASYKKGVMGKILDYQLVQVKHLQGYMPDGNTYKINFVYETEYQPIIEVTMNLMNGTDLDNPHTPGTATSIAENPKTGDETRIWIPLLLMVVSGIGIVVLSMKRKNE